MPAGRWTMMGFILLYQEPVYYDALVNRLLKNWYNKHQGKFASAITGW
jgi:hypothetical protein